MTPILHIRKNPSSLLRTILSYARDELPFSFFIFFFFFCNYIWLEKFNRSSRWEKRVRGYWRSWIDLIYSQKTNRILCQIWGLRISSCYFCLDRMTREDHRPSRCPNNCTRHLHHARNYCTLHKWCICLLDTVDAFSATSRSTLKPKSSYI